MPSNTMTEKTVRRLKANGYVPEGDPIRIVIHRQRDARLRWTVVNASTGEPYQIGSLVNIDGMFKIPWTTIHEGDWTILSPGREET